MRARISSGSTNAIPSSAVGDPLRGEDVRGPARRRRLVDVDAAAVVDLDLDHFLRRGAGLFGVPLVRLDDPLHELVPDDVLVPELDEADPVDVA